MCIITTEIHVLINLLSRSDQFYYKRVMEKCESFILRQMALIEVRNRYASINKHRTDFQGFWQCHITVQVYENLRKLTRPLQNMFYVMSDGNIQNIDSKYNLFSTKAASFSASKSSEVQRLSCNQLHYIESLPTDMTNK